MLPAPAMLLAGLLLATPAQSDTATFLDADARSLLAQARVARDELGQSIRSYTATIKQRLGVSLRTPLKDRMLYRHESASRVRWSRDQESVVKVLGARNFHPGQTVGKWDIGDFNVDELFDPAGDRLYFGFMSPDGDRDDDEDMWIAHPLAEGSERDYRFAAGDTITISLPDGKRIQVAELRILPRENSPHLLSGSVWVEPSTGAIVKAAYRLARPLDIEKDTNEMEDDEDMKNIPGILKPMEFDITMISIEYSFWRLQHWLPRSMRMEGSARAGIVVAPAAMELAYNVESVTDDSDPVADSVSARAVLRQWRSEEESRVIPRRSNGKRVYVVLPDDESKLLVSPDLPPPIWESSPEFITERELREMYANLADLPMPPVIDHDAVLKWGHQAKDLARFNRVEGLSLGVRGGTTVQLGRLDATARIGVADLHPNVRGSWTRETLRRTVTLGAEHGLNAVDEQALTLGSSVGALLLGRDDGEYYYTTRAALTFAPPKSRTEWYTFELFAQNDQAAEQKTNWSLPRLFDSGQLFRPNIQASEGTYGGGALTLRKWWGSEPMGWQAGSELKVEAADGDYRFARGSATLRTAFPLFKGVRAGIEVAGGTSEGDLPVQRNWYLGGVRTLRGYAGSAAVGTSFARARAELARTSSIGGIALFTDAGWAGQRDAFDQDDALLSVGIGATLLDGLLRFDVARALRKSRGWRVELYLDALL